jgi:hypothetical protein
MTIDDGLTTATVVGERLPRLFAPVVTVYFGFLAVFVPLRYGVKHEPRSAMDIYLAAVVVALILGCYRGWRQALIVDGTGLTVRNFFRTYRIGWSQVRTFADGNAGLAIGGSYAWALAVVTDDLRPVVVSATTRYSGARAETLTVIRQHAELHGIAADVAGEARKLRPRRRNFVGDLIVWLVIFAAVWYPMSLLAHATHCTTC